MQRAIAAFRLSPWLHCRNERRHFLQILQCFTALGAGCPREPRYQAVRMRTAESHVAYSTSTDFALELDARRFP